MLKSIEFENFRNLKGKYIFNDNLNIVIGKNNSGKTNLLDGIRLAFSSINGDYFKLKKSDFYSSDDSIIIQIKVIMDKDDIPTLTCVDEQENKICGFIVKIYKMSNGKYKRDIFLYNGGSIDKDILLQDLNLPTIYEIPFIRVGDLYMDGLVTNINKFIENDENYINIQQKSKDAIKKEIKEKEEIFRNLCSKFEQEFEIALTDAKLENEKVYIVEKGEKEHNYNIGSGYRSVANILLNVIQRKNSIMLIDEIENHLHPSLIRTLIRELKSNSQLFVIATTHSPVVINEMDINSLIDISNIQFNTLDKKNIDKLNIFMHPGRGELLLADNIILVEGYTEELLLSNYLYINNKNITIINVGGVMFEPYIEIATLLKKNILVISDNDISKGENNEPTARFKKLSKLCKEKNIKLIEVYNTLETDLYKNGFLDGLENLLIEKDNYMIARDKKKTEIAINIIRNATDLSNWHVMEEINNEFKSN